MPDSTELIESNKRIMMISVTGKVKIAPEFCEHSMVVDIHEGHEYTIYGEHEDNTRSYAQCLICGAVKRDDGTWGETLKCDDEKEIEF